MIHFNSSKNEVKGLFKNIFTEHENEKDNFFSFIMLFILNYI